MSQKEQISMEELRRQVVARRKKVGSWGDGGSAGFFYHGEIDGYNFVLDLIDGKDPSDRLLGPAFKKEKS